MSEQKFKESKSSLAFSQCLLDRMRASQTAEMGSEMPQEAPMQPKTEEVMVDETPRGAKMGPTEEVAEEPQEESRLERMFGEFMDTMNKFFKREQDKEPETTHQP